MMKSRTISTQFFRSVYDDFPFIFTYVRDIFRECLTKFTVVFETGTEVTKFFRVSFYEQTPSISVFQLYWSQLLYPDNNTFNTINCLPLRYVNNLVQHLLNNDCTILW